MKLLASCMVVVAALVSPVAQAAGAAAKDPVVFSFATVGDSRSDPAVAENEQDRIWIQNTRALGRMLREIGDQKPKALFFNGDMIMGYSTDKAVLDREYAYWRGMVTALQTRGVYVVPVPGNHEVQVKQKVDGKAKKVAVQSSEDSWRDNMGDLIMDPVRWRESTGQAFTAFSRDNKPAIGGEDPIVTDQAQLSYSFDYGRAHFVVINTDPVGNDSHAPVHWLEQDIQAAQARGMQDMYVFGHKLAFTYAYKDGVALAGLDEFPDNQEAFWRVIEASGATYFCGHEHIFHLSQPWKSRGGRAWQVVVGSGGSPFAARPGDSPRPEDRMYAWALVSVHASGKTDLTVYGFDDHYGRTRVIRRVSY